MVDTTHVFTLSQVYEGLLLKMGEKGNDGGQFFTPREIIRAMVRVVDPQLGETVYDPGCGTGGFLAQSFEQMTGVATPTSARRTSSTPCRQHTFYGREKDNAIYPIALANLVLHGIDAPHIWHGNTLTGDAAYDGLFDGRAAALRRHSHEPALRRQGGQGRPDALRLQDRRHAGALPAARDRQPEDTGGRCGMVIDEGVLFRTNETAFVQTKRKLLDDCDLWCIVSMPPGCFRRPAPA